MTQLYTRTDKHTKIIDTVNIKIKMKMKTEIKIRIVTGNEI